MLGYAGEVRLDGRDFAKLHGAEHRALRRRIQVVFQDPRESMNLRLSIGEIIAEPLRLKGGVSGAVLRSRVAGLLGDVGLSGELAARLPHTVSGGQAQRIAIARALAAEPELLVLDEPTSALDVSTQAMLLNLLKDIAYKRALSTLLISHDFAVVTYMADRIAVLKAGELIELAETTRLISNPQHAYTAALIGAAPQLRG
jgi:ABC-type glutathione transport system ATPase component